MMIDAREARNVTCRSSRGGIKYAYTTEREAAAARKVLIASGSSRARLRVYACTYHGWHIGHMMDRNQ